MLRTFLTLIGLLGSFAFIGMIGCGKAGPSAADSTKSANTSEEKAVAAPVSHDAKETAEPDPKITEALAKLSAEDRALAEKQKVCPVSGEPLGAMGTPKKIEVKGQSIFICCEGCEEKLLANPDKYLAKLNK